MCQEDRRIAIPISRADLGDGQSIVKLGMLKQPSIRRLHCQFKIQITGGRGEQRRDGGVGL